MEKKETNEKEYYNYNLDKMLSKYITREVYGDFTVILRDIFQRRAYEFGFSEEHMEKEASNFINKVKSIGFVPKEEMSSETAMGVYSSRESNIKINQDWYLNYTKGLSEFDYGTKMFETLTHEVYHGITDIGSQLGLMYVKNNEWRGAALNEVFTETAANRASMPRGAKEAEQYRSDTDGYPDITFVANLLAASIGTSEKELLKAGAQNRTQLIEVFASKFPSGKPLTEANKLFEKMESSLDIIYNVRYSKESQKTQEERDVDAQLLEGALSTLYGTAFELASHQIAHDKKDISSNYVGELTYRYSKMEKIMEDSLNLFEAWKNITPQIKSKVYVKAEPFRKKLADRVIGVDTIQRASHRITNPNDLETLSKSAKQGKLALNFIALKKYRINLGKSTSESVSSITEDLEQYNHVMEEDFDNGKVWDNTDVSTVMKKIFIADMERKGLIHKPTEAELQDTEELPIVDKTEELPVVDKTEELPVVEPTEELPIVDGNENKKGILGKLKDSINIIVTRFKNRNQQKLNQGRETREGDNSEYYASLATKSVESSLEQYIVKPEQLQHSPLKLEDINVGKEQINEKEMQDDDGR